MTDEPKTKAKGKAKNETLLKAVEASRVVERPIEDGTNRMVYAQANFSNMDLTKRLDNNNPDSPFQYQFKTAVLKGSDFSGANLEGQNFQGADLRGVDFSGANCKGCDFRWAIMNDIIYDENTDFTGANFWESAGLPINA